MEHYLSPRYQFWSGAGLMAALVCALFFFRFWRKSNDRIFAIFGVAFAILGFERIMLASYTVARANEPRAYLIRLAAFAMILWGIWDKNRKRGEG